MDRHTSAGRDPFGFIPQQPSSLKPKEESPEKTKRPMANTPEASSNTLDKKAKIDGASAKEVLSTKITGANAKEMTEPKNTSKMAAIGDKMMDGPGDVNRMQLGKEVKIAGGSAKKVAEPGNTSKMPAVGPKKADVPRTLIRAKWPQDEKNMPDFHDKWTTDINFLREFMDAVEQNEGRTHDDYNGIAYCHLYMLLRALFAVKGNFTEEDKEARPDLERDCLKLIAAKLLSISTKKKTPINRITGTHLRSEMFFHLTIAHQGRTGTIGQKINLNHSNAIKTAVYAACPFDGILPRKFVTEYQMQNMRITSTQVQEIMNTLRYEA
jgi:hypothetical protein